MGWGRGVRVCVLYSLCIEQQCTYSNSKVRTFFGSEEVLAGLKKTRFYVRMRVWVSPRG